MKDNHHKRDGNGNLTRRRFLGMGGMAIAGASLPSTAWGAPTQPKGEFPEKQMIQQNRSLGRTGFMVSDIAMGCAPVKDSNLVRYAYDKGINYFDTSEMYGNGLSESSIGKAMPFMDRSKVFVTTKLGLKGDDTKESLVDRFTKCQERLNTPYVDALLVAGAATVAQVKQEAFHEAVARLKADGRVKHAGVACHGPRGMGGDSMEKVLLAAVDDGRYDIMLLTYNFLNSEEAETVLEACKKKDIATTAMKTAPGKIKEVPDFDPENPGKAYGERIKMMMGFGLKRESAVYMVAQMVAAEKTAREQTKPFLAKYGLRTEDQLWEASIKWVLGNPDMHSVCISMPDFGKVDQSVSLSGKQLTEKQQAFLGDYETSYGWSYCRHGCSRCMDACKSVLPVSTIMRYAYYYEQGYEKLAMEKYAALKAVSATCAGCEAPCESACPHGVLVKSNLLNAHTMLTLA